MKLVIFDLDDTLINFAETRKAAYACMAEHLSQEGIDATAYLQACVEVDRPLFTLFEQGRITRAQYRLQRFSDPFDRIGLVPRSGLVEHLNKVFMDCVNDAPLLFEDVHPVLDRLRAQQIRTAILTNGPSDGQRRKLKATGLDAWVDFVAIGEELGYSKPAPQAFRSVLERFRVAGEDTVMVGDSPELDYDAAIHAGLQALLLDRAAQHVEGSRIAIRSLNAVLQPGATS